MKIAFVEINGVNGKMSVSNRNAKILCEILNAKHIKTRKDIKAGYNKIILGYPSFRADIEAERLFFKLNPVKNVFWISTEYDVARPSSAYYNNLNIHRICNYKGRSRNENKEIIKTTSINLNLLISKESNIITEKKYDCIYYGRYRDDRKVYFEKYIQKRLYLSTSKKNMKKFKNKGCNPKYLDAISWDENKETLNLFKYSLYIEDEYTHSVFNNLANRWYEAGFCNNVVFFDVNCWNTIRKSEIAQYEEQIKDYIVNDYQSLNDKIDYCNKDFEKHLAIQKGWRINEPQLRLEMINKLKE